MLKSRIVGDLKRNTLYFGMISAVLAAGLLSSEAQAANLVTNGDFTAGNTGFSSDYSYDGPYSNNGAYYLLSDVNGFKDHTTGDGLFLLGDGASVADQSVWRETVSTVANADYTFSFFHSEFNNGPNAVLAFFVDGAQTGGAVAPQDRTWNQFSQSFNAGAGTTHKLEIRDLTLGYSYNDFGLDDIALQGPSAASGAPEPESWALMIVGFGLAGAFARRRRAAVAT